MKYQILVNEVSVNELKEMITEAVATEVKRCIPTILEPADALLTRHETAKILKVSLPTLHFWTRDGKIRATRIGTRVRYRREDVEAALSDIDVIKYKKPLKVS